MRRIVEECYAEAITTLTEHRDQLESLDDGRCSSAETLDEADAYAAAGVPRAGREPGADRRGHAGSAHRTGRERRPGEST